MLCVGWVRAACVLILVQSRWSFLYLYDGEPGFGISFLAVWSHCRAHRERATPSDFWGGFADLGLACKLVRSSSSTGCCPGVASLSAIENKATQTFAHPHTCDLNSSPNRSTSIDKQWTRDGQRRETWKQTQCFLKYFNFEQFCINRKLLKFVKNTNTDMHFTIFMLLII